MYTKRPTIKRRMINSKYKPDGFTELIVMDLWLNKIYRKSQYRSIT